MSASADLAQHMTAIQRIAVIGAGRRGRAFALRCLEAGFAVVLEDVLSSKLRIAEEELGSAAVGQDSLELANSVEDAVRAADLAIDFVPDELESKLEIFSLMDRMAPPRTILCTPTNLSITDLASCTYRRERCIGMKPFTAESLQEAELVRGAQTSEETAKAVQDWLEAMHVSVHISDAPAFTASSF